MSGGNHRKSANMFIETIDAHNEQGTADALKKRTKYKRLELVDIDDEAGRQRWAEINNSPRYAVLKSQTVTAAQKIRMLIIFWEFLDIPEENFEDII